MSDRLIKSLREYFAGRKDVAFAYLFGSRARGDGHKRSDVDIACMGTNGRCDRLAIAAELSDLLGCEVDVVDLARLRNNSLLLDIIREGVVLKDHSRREHWELEHYHRVLDFFASTRRVYGY